MNTRAWLALAWGMVLLAVSERPAAAFYDPHAGRWLTRDPIEEEDAPNIYAFSANNPVMFVDPLGLWKWKGGKRQGKSRAVIIAEKGDTIESLAVKVRLEGAESAKWLKGPDGNPVPRRSMVVEGCEYSVPNVFVVAVGGNLGRLVEPAALNFANQVIKQANSEGFNHEFLWYSNSPYVTSDMKRYMNGDLWGIAMYGHGVVFHGYFAIDTVWDFKRTDLPDHTTESFR